VAVRSAARAPHTLSDDRAAGLHLEPTIRPVTGRYVISDGERSVTLIDVGENPHAAGMLVAWLAEERILYQADLFEPAPDSVFPSRARLPVMRWFVDWLDASGLAPERIYAIHGRGRVTPAQLQAIREAPISTSAPANTSLDAAAGCRAPALRAN
jgi:hypothetical protein